MDVNLAKVRSDTLSFIDKCRVPELGPGRYRYSTTVDKPTLYSSTYAAMTQSLYGTLDQLPRRDREEWADHLNRFQDDDGLYRDPVIYDQGKWYKGDPLWCGRSHLTCHVMSAIVCLGGTVGRAISFINAYKDTRRLGEWLESRNWDVHVAPTGNEIMNVGTLLQYARDCQNDAEAGKAVEFLLDWLDHHQLNTATGVWGSGGIDDPKRRSSAVQTAYHWWALYFYDRRTPPCVERAIDTILATQNPNGGFGWGCHNSSNPYFSSACEDIDSIDPLVRMSLATTYRRGDIDAALRRALPWLLSNQTADGGFVFIQKNRFEYGHPQLSGEENVGAMFPTWFRTLTLAYLCFGLRLQTGDHRWVFKNSPGYQFWREA